MSGTTDNLVRRPVIIGGETVLIRAGTPDQWAERDALRDANTTSAVRRRAIAGLAAINGQATPTEGIE